MRSLATRDFATQRDQRSPARCGGRLQGAGFDLIVVETSGIGQGDAAIVPHVDVPMYVMTPEFGAASQLEKIDMLDFAEFVAINKFDRKGAQTRCATWPSRCSATAKPGPAPDDMPVFGTMAAASTTTA
jgi:methylmalonyl-CoA mutase